MEFSQIMRGIVPVLVGMLVIFIVVMVAKGAKQKQAYDERQQLEQLKASRLGFLVMLCVACMYAVCLSAWEPMRAYSALFLSVLLFAGLGSYAVYAIIKDAFLGIKQSPGRYLLLCIAIILANLISPIIALMQGTPVAEYLKSLMVLNLVIPITFSMILGRDVPSDRAHKYSMIGVAVSQM